MNSSIVRSSRVVLLVAMVLFGGVLACAKADDVSKPVIDAPLAKGTEASKAAVLTLRGEMPATQAAAAVRIQQVNFPAGANSIRVYLLAPGLEAGSIDASGYICTRSTGHQRNLLQDFQLPLESAQVRALLEQKSQGAQSPKALVLIEAIDRTGKPVSGVAAAVATLVDGNTARP